MANAELGGTIFDVLVNDQPDLNIGRLDTLFQDFVAGAVLGEKHYGTPTSTLCTGITERAVRLGLYTSALDMDDVDWKVLTHPGSIIWPVATAIGVELKLPLDDLYLAASYGYRSGATLANFFGASHRSKWHVTSTSGAFAATSTAAIALGLTPHQHKNALHICAANIGGSPQAGFERKGAPQTNRAAAISLGITSAHAALLGAPHIEDVWNGSRGIIEMFNIEASTSQILDGVSTAELRLIDTNGFAHSAVVAASKLYLELKEKVDSITVVLPASVKGILDASRGGAWWNSAYAVAALWESGDPTNLQSASHFLSLTSLEFEEMPIGAGRVRVTTSSGVHEEYVERAPEEISWRDIKWGKAGISSSKEAYLRCSNFPLSALR
jgi:2-methylcitrate dehydratase PrpD